LERHKRLDSTFATLDANLIIDELQIVAKKRISSESILFLDEAQGAPNSLAALRYFFENKPEIPVVTAGSLLEFALADHDFSMPVGRVEFTRMFPVTFSEYLGATNATLELELLTAFISGKYPSIPENAHLALMKLFSEYVLIGGMPAAVAASLKRDNVVAKLEAASTVHERLVEAFRDDFAKYRKRIPAELLRSLFDAIPTVAANTRVKYSNLNPNERTESVKRGLSALISAGIVNKIVHTPARGIPLSTGADADVFKLLPLDVGMSSTQSLGVTRTSALPQALFTKWESGNPIERHWMGQIAESIVGQSILAQNSSRNSLYYWLREGRASNAEVDYVVQCGTTIVPVEVKSGVSGSLKSLHQFVAERGLKHAVRFDLNPPSTQNVCAQALLAGGESKTASYTLHNLPIYCSDFLFEFARTRALS
jgi:predicted AAA+ superfamily ATPase